MIFYSNHHVMPHEIVFAEIYSPDIGDCVIYKDELLMVSLGKLHHEGAGTVGKFHMNIVSDEVVDHQSRLPPFMANSPIEETSGGIQEFIAQDKFIVGIDEKLSVTRTFG